MDAAAFPIERLIGDALLLNFQHKKPGDAVTVEELIERNLTLYLAACVNALPPNHELMLVTTGGQMNVRVQPTRDYLEIQEAIGEINYMRSMGNALIGSVHEVYERYMRTAERRYPMIVIVSTDGRDMSQRISDKSVNEMLQGLTKTGVMVNAILLTSTGTSLIRSVTLEMLKRTGGAYESATVATALPARIKAMAGTIAKQYAKVSPGKVPTAEFKRSAPR
jgi:hypothetical protein